MENLIRRSSSRVQSNHASSSVAGSDQSSVDESPLPGVQPRKVLRGKTVCRYLTLLPKGTKLPVDFDDKHRPIGKYKSLFTSQQGVIVRNMELTPINKKSWRCVSNDIKNNMVEALLFEIGDDPLRIVAVKRQLGKKWRDFRCTLKKKYYEPYNSDTDRMENMPNYVKPDEWKWLLDEYWGTEKIQDLCEKNSEHRDSQGMLHRTGRKSFAVVDNEEFLMTGDHPDRMRMFDLAYKGNDEDSSEFIKKKQDSINKLRLDREEGLNDYTDADIFDKVFGGDKYGRVLCRGYGVTPTMEFGSSRNGSQSTQESRNDLEEARKDAEKANNKCAELTLELQSTNETILAMQKRMDQMYEMLAMTAGGGLNGAGGGLNGAGGVSSNGA